jgi:FkbM family methyltransferase
MNPGLNPERFFRRKSSIIIRCLRLLFKNLPPRLEIPLRSKFGGARDAEIELLAQFVTPGDFVLDVGSHMGAYSYELLLLVGPHGRVMGFEPQDDMFIYTRMGLKAFPNFYITPFALAGEFGLGQLEIVENKGSLQTGGASLLPKVDVMKNQKLVAKVPLDSLNLQKVTFIKIDTEGFELEVIKGALETLKLYRPHLLIEILKSENFSNSKEIKEILEDDLNYSSFCLMNGVLTQYGGAAYCEVEGRMKDRSVNFFFIPN